MALTKLNTRETTEGVKDNLDKYVTLLEREEVLSESYQLLLDELIKSNPQLLKAKKALEKCRGDLEETKVVITSSVRDKGTSVKAGTVSAHYSNPKVIHYDLDTLERIQPGISEIPNLIRKSVDMEVLEAAVAAGYVEYDTISEARVEVPRYKNGRVQIRMNNRTS